MSLFKSFAEKTKSSKESVDRKPYTLNETLAVMKLMNDEVALADIATRIGRSVPSLRARFTDPKRGVMKILENGGPEALFKKYNETYISLEDVSARIELFNSSLPTATAISSDDKSGAA